MKPARNSKDWEDAGTVRAVRVGAGDSEDRSEGTGGAKDQ